MFGLDDLMVCPDFAALFDTYASPNNLHAHDLLYHNSNIPQANGVSALYYGRVCFDWVVYLFEDGTWPGIYFEYKIEPYDPSVYI